VVTGRPSSASPLAPKLDDATYLNLGCGAYKKPGFLNVDVDPSYEPDMLIDLSVFPYPFSDNRFELIEADHVLEHLNDPFRIMRELHRILVPGGKLVIRVPHFSRGFTHADHKRGFDVTFAYYFNRSFEVGFLGIPFDTERARLRWFAQPYLKQKVLSAPSFFAARAVGAVIDVFANLSPFLCSRLWCFWVGGFEEIEFVFRKPRPAK
jgi:SAM-dependent methyltransferase